MILTYYPTGLTYYGYELHCRKQITLPSSQTIFFQAKIILRISICFHVKTSLLAGFNHTVLV